MTTAAADSAPPGPERLPRLRFDLPELAGACGDLGTDLPILAGILLATGADSTGVLVAFGAAQVATGLIYGLPMPVQPLKVMAVVVLAGRASAGLLQLAGLMIGVIMLGLAGSGWLDRIGRLVPLCVVRGIQAGLGLSLARSACGLIGRDGSPWAWGAAAAAVAALVALRRHPRLPGALLVIGASLAWAVWYRLDWTAFRHGWGWQAPRAAAWPWADWTTALTLLVLPQLPLSLSNSVIATRQTVRDLFPGRELTLRAIGLTYAGLNLLVPWLGGVPVCHGCGGLAGYYALGARTGGAVVIYGAGFIVAGLAGGAAALALLHAFPACILGALLLVEAALLCLLARDLRRAPAGLLLAGTVAAACLLLPQGYFAGLLAGTGVYYVLRAGGVHFHLRS